MRMRSRLRLRQAVRLQWLRVLRQSRGVTLGSLGGSPAVRYSGE
jgi:hypothetical protein